MDHTCELADLISRRQGQRNRLVSHGSVHGAIAILITALVMILAVVSVPWPGSAVLLSAAFAGGGVALVLLRRQSRLIPTDQLGRSSSEGDDPE